MSFFERHVRGHFHPAFFEDLLEALDSACAGARARSAPEVGYLPEHQVYVEGTERHYAVQEVLTRLSVHHGAQKFTLRAGSYPIAAARHGRFILTACVADSLKRLERSKARRYLASLNAVVEPYQPDFFESEPVAEPSVMSAMIIVARGHRDELPSAVYLGVPTASFRGWHFYQEISDIFRLYDESPVAEPVAAPSKRPRLRHVPRSKTIQIRRKKN